MTTKYNPARTWTPENAVGIGGAYLCVYGMEGPGGYQFVGRTCQVWNTYKVTDAFTRGHPWLLRFFDQIRFHPVCTQELLDFRADFLHGRAHVGISESTFRLRDYRRFLARQRLKHRRAQSAPTSRVRGGTRPLASTEQSGSMRRCCRMPDEPEPRRITRGLRGGIEPRFRQRLAHPLAPGQRVKAGDTLVLVESMKMEVAVTAPADGMVSELRCVEGRPVSVRANPARGAGERAAGGGLMSPVLLKEDMTCLSFRRPRILIGLAVRGAAPRLLITLLGARRTSFNVAWSIYVGWMPWDFADQSGILKKWADKYGIKIKLTQINDYVESINQYTAGGFDACVMTNMDMLTIPAAGGVDSTALIVGDFSNGNDGVVLKGEGKRLADIKGQKVNLVELSVSHYLLVRALAQHRTARTRHQGRQHLGRRHRRCIRRAGDFSGGHLEAAVELGAGVAAMLNWCSIRARFRERSSI